MNAPQETYQIGKSTYQRTVYGFYFNVETPVEVRRAISSAYASGRRVRIFYGDRETGVTWDEENDVCGTIGRSMGPCHVPLLIHNARSMGGGALLDSCVVGILTGPGRFAYRHPTFDNGIWEACAISETYGTRTYRGASYRNGELIGRHETLAKAERFAAFMRGERMGK